MPIARVRETEPFDIALRRFKRMCEKAGIISEMRRHESYEKPKWKRKRLKAQAKKRLLKMLSRERSIPVRGIRGAAKRKSRRGRKTGNE